MIWNSARVTHDMTTQTIKTPKSRPTVFIDGKEF